MVDAMAASCARRLSKLLRFTTLVASPRAAAPLPPVFGWLRDQGQMELFELARTFNCGIGLIIYVEADKADAVLQALKNGPEPDALTIGKLVSRDGSDAVILENSDRWLGHA